MYCLRKNAYAIVALGVKIHQILSSLDCGAPNELSLRTPFVYSIRELCIENFFLSSRQKRQKCITFSVLTPNPVVLGRLRIQRALLLYTFCLFYWIAVHRDFFFIPHVKSGRSVLRFLSSHQTLSSLDCGHPILTYTFFLISMSFFGLS